MVTTPKTPKSNRMIVMPQILCDEMQEYLTMFYTKTDTDRIFPITKHYLKHEMERGSKKAGVKRIRIYSLRHTFSTMALENGMDIKLLSSMLGHVSSATTIDIL